MILIFPMAAMFLLSAVVLIITFVTRVKAVRSRKVRLSYFTTYSSEVTDQDMLKASRHFSNLFEAPVLFYAVCLGAMIAGVQQKAFLITAWLYVIARVAHAYAHIGPNRLYPRMTVYFVSWIFLTALWVQLVIHAAL